MRTLHRRLLSAVGRGFVAGLAVVLVAGCLEDSAPSQQQDAAVGDAGASGLDAANTDGNDVAAFSAELRAAAAKLFDANHIVQVVIELPAADWDAVRSQQRVLDGFVQPNCHDKPYTSPFTYRKAKVTIDGHTFVDAGVRKKGFVGSNDIHKPSLKIRFDKFVDGQTFAGVRRLTLNNNKQDRAELSQCLAYDVFGRAGVPASRCNFAHVWVNGVDLGLFTHVEGIRKAMVGRHFSNADGPLWEGTLSDFRDGWTATFEPKNSAADKDDAVAKLTNALQADDKELLTAVGALVDLPAFMRFWAVESLIHHRDGYASNRNNFYLYRDPTGGKLHFLPWGTDNVLRPFEKRPPKMPYMVFAGGALARRLYDHPQGRSQYVAAMKAVLAGPWDEKHLTAEIARIQPLIAATAKIHSFNPGRAPAGTDQMTAPLKVITDFINTRRKQVEAELGTLPDWPFPPPEPFCFELSTEATGTLLTTFGTLNNGNIFQAGTGTVAGKSPQGLFGPLQTGAAAGWNKDDPSRLQLQLVFPHPTTAGLFVVVALLVDGDALKTGKPIALRGFLTGGGGFLVQFNGQTKQSQVTGLLWEGSVTFAQLGTKPGDAIDASFSSKWIKWGGPS